MRKIMTLFFALILVAFNLKAFEVGILTSNPSPIIPNQSVVISYDGTGTNFANWTPKCYVHIWLNPKSGLTFSKSYATTWNNIIGDAAYEALDSKLKLTHDGVEKSGKYSMTINNLYDYFSVEEVDKPIIGELGVIVKTQYVGQSESGNRTDDLKLTVTNPSTEVTSISDNIEIYTDNKKITVDFFGEASVSLYTLNGQLLKSEVVANHFVHSVNQGIYFLRINGKSHKVIVQ